MQITTEKKFDQFRYKKFKSLYPFNDDLSFMKWLEANSMSETDFNSLFKSLNEKVTIKDNQWINYLIDEYQPKNNLSYDNLFCRMTDFFMVKAISMLKVQLKNHELTNHPQLNLQNLISIFKSQLTNHYVEMITPTLTLELNVARINKQLKGETHEARFKSFIDLLSDKHFILNIFNEYPLLLQKLIVVTENHLSQFTEFIFRLHNDIEELNLHFGYLGSFTGIDGVAGDSHNQGRSVKVCSFQNSKIVYKPRSLTVDEKFGQLLNDLNHEINTTFKWCKIMRRQQYGWSEFINFEASKSRTEAENYYLSMGHYLALLYVLNSGDFHHENIIRSGANPILVDLESIFHVNFINGTQYRCDDESLETTLHTVLNSMLLPHKTQFVGQKLGIDITALGHHENQQVHLQMGKLVNQARDDMHYQSNEVYTEHIEHRSELESSYNLSPNEITELLINGFSYLYDFFLNQPGWLINNHSFNQLCNQHYRCILRPTDSYHQLITCTHHPDYLRNSLDRDLLIEEKLWSLTQNMGHLRRTARYEADSIKENDIPIFYFQANALNLFTGDGQVINNYFNHSIKARIKNTINHLSLKDKKAQIWLIKATMGTHQIPDKLLPFKNQELIYSDADSFCHNITAELLSCAHQRGELLHWNNLDMLNETQWTINSNKEFEFFNGNLGSLFYLMSYSDVYQDTKLAKTVESTTEYLCNKLSYINFSYIGGYVGIGGVIYSLSYIQKSTDNQAIKKALIDLCHQAITKVGQDQSFDFLHGAAGCLLAAIYAHKSLQESCFLDLAKYCADHLVENFKELPVGGGWENTISKANVLGGFSHGVTGIAYALANYDDYTNQSVHSSIISKAFIFEDSLYDKKNHNYRDLRDPDSCCTNHDGLFAWCNGGLGIEMSRFDLIQRGLLCKHQYSLTNYIDKSVSKALSAMGHNHSLCHGDASLLSYLDTVSKCCPEVMPESKFNQILDQTIQDIDKNGLKNAIPFNQFNPGLMLGSLGLAFELLRQKNRSKVPKLLLLQ